METILDLLYILCIISCLYYFWKLIVLNPEKENKIEVKKPKTQEMFFKATKKESESYGRGSYRKIIKEGDISIDTMKDSDDVIRIDCFDLVTKEPIYNSIGIDLDNKEGKFRIFTIKYR